MATLHNMGSRQAGLVWRWTDSWQRILPSVIIILFRTDTEAFCRLITLWLLIEAAEWHKMVSVLSVQEARELLRLLWWRRSFRALMPVHVSAAAPPEESQLIFVAEGEIERKHDFCRSGGGWGGGIWRFMIWQHKGRKKKRSQEGGWEEGFNDKVKCALMSRRGREFRRFFFYWCGILIYGSWGCLWLWGEDFQHHKWVI